MQIPATLDGELPSRAFGARGVPILVGERYVVPDAEGREVAGELTSAVMMEHDKHVMAALRLQDGTNAIYKMPVNDAELAIYKDSPETFPGSMNRTATSPSQ